jgi:paired amphipathic helix protein Sin3a
MSENHKKNPSNQKDLWPEHSVEKGHYPDDGTMRYGEYGSAKGGPGGYYPGINPAPHSMGRNNEMSSDTGFHGAARIQSPSRGPSEDADLSDAMVYLNTIKQ